jgi:hypothetical protein
MAISNPQSDFVFPSGRDLRSRVRLGGNPSHVRGRFFPMPYQTEASRAFPNLRTANPIPIISRGRPDA